MLTSSKTQIGKLYKKILPKHEYSQFLKELYKVIKKGGFDNTTSLLTSFVWDESPQGFGFWNDLHEKELTYKAF